jgi:cyclophilin family peptidyl-prolyl cis-trans isomerase
MLGPLFPRAVSSFKRSRSARRRSPHRAALPGVRRRWLSAETLEARWYLSADPIVTVDTNFGNFQIDLFASSAPQTVANFLAYVNSGDYNNSFVTRSVQNFVIQGGGATTSSATFSGSSSQFSAVPNLSGTGIPSEAGTKNTVGTIAMALSTGPNTGTNQWFINLAANPALDGTSNGGPFTVFGAVIGNGMQVVNQIAALPTKSVNSTVPSVGLSNLPVSASNQLVVISSMSVDSIDGTVFTDANGNGQLDSSEQGVPGRTVFVDKDGTGTPTANDPQTTTDANGHYSFSGLAAGSYTVREVLPSGISLTTATQTVAVAAGQTAAANFGEQPSLSGKVFIDLNGNGTLDPGEPGASGQTVFLNVDGTGSPTNNPHTTTLADGSFSFTGLAAGNYTVMEVAPSGVSLTTGAQTATITAGHGVSGLLFGEKPSIVGLVFLDANSNGQPDSGEQAISGRTVYLDIDNSHAPDASNPSTTTNANGLYYFLGLAAGNYSVREVAPSGTIMTTPAQNITLTAGQIASSINFGEVPPSIVGTVFVDMNKNGTFDTGDLGLAGRTVFLDNDHTGSPTNNPKTTTDALGKYFFAGLTPGTYNVREVVAAGVVLTTTNQSVTVTANNTTSGVNFGEGPAITGTVFTDTNGNGALDASEQGVSGRTVFLNVDGTGAPDAANPSVTTDANGNYVFSGIANGTYHVLEVLPSNVPLTTSAQTAIVTSGQTIANVNFGEKPAIAGMVFIDLNANGQFDAGEQGVPGQKVFLDVDGTGAPSTNNPSTITDSNGNYTFSGLAPGSYPVKEVLPSGVTLTTSAQAVAVVAGQTKSGVNFGDKPAIAGTVFTDSNGNGILDSGEQGVAGRTVFLDSNHNGVFDNGEPSTVTNASGNYAFLGLAPGSYAVGEAPTSGVVLSTSPTELVTVTAGQANTGVNFGEAVDTTTAEISGTVFEDSNLNGRLDAGEQGLAGRTVFVDRDGSGAPGPNNPSATTDASGHYSFLGLPAGTFTVREIVSADHGVTISTPLQSVAVIVGQTKTANFGNVLMSTLSPLPVSPGNASSTSTPSDPNAAYIDAVYQSVLGRAADPASLTYWQGRLGQGASRADVARGVWDSTEHRSSEIEQYYHTFLGRASDSVGKAFWLAAFNAWGTEENVIATFVTSDEYSTRLHPTADNFVNALYNDIDNRTADAKGLNDWTTALQNGQSRLQVATAFINGQESSGELVDGYFAAFLHRSADAAGRHSWIDTLTSAPTSLNAKTIEEAGIQILATDEYFTRVASPTP